MSETFTFDIPHVSGVCTSPWRETPETIRHARQLGDWFGCRVVRRRNRSIAQLFADENADVVIVAEESPKLYHRSDPAKPLFFHLGMADQRLSRLKRGEPDRLLSVAGIRPGDVALDATLGLGSDTLVLSYGVGQAGRVTSVESSWWLFRLFTHAQTRELAQSSQLAALFRRINVIHGDHGEVLSAMDDDSVDVVLFDPMFRRAPDRGSDMEPARAFANPSPLSLKAWEEAKRVARKAVVIKERPNSGEFERLGVPPDRPRSRFAYGVWHKDGAVRG